MFNCTFTGVLTRIICTALEINFSFRFCLMHYFPYLFFFSAVAVIWRQRDISATAPAKDYSWTGKWRRRRKNSAIFFQRAAEKNKAVSVRDNVVSRQDPPPAHPAKQFSCSAAAFQNATVHITRVLLTLTNTRRRQGAGSKGTDGGNTF